MAEVKAREVAPGGDLAGVRVLLDGGDKNPPCRYHTNPTCEGPWFTTANGTAVTPGFNDYTVEVVQQAGSDSFSPGHGVLIGKSKNANSSCGTFNCFVWYVDSNPQDINQVDYLKADGTPVKATIGDERQTNDGSFNAGAELRLDLRVQGGEQPPALLRHQQAHGCRRHAALHGRRALARRCRPADARRVASARRRRAPPRATRPARSRSRTRAWRRRSRPTTHPQDASAYLGSDVYRLSASASGTGWTAHLKNALATAKFGETVQVPVYIDKAAGAAATGSVTLNATSESDPTKSMSVNCAFGAGDTVGGTVPATLALTHGHGGELRRVHARPRARTTSPPPRRT